MYFGTEKNVKNPFSKCKSNTEIFHLARRIQTEQRNMLNRICISIDNQGLIRLKGNAPQPGIIKIFTQKIFENQT
jgi:hypothetical protein